MRRDWGVRRSSNFAPSAVAQTPTFCFKDRTVRSLILRIALRLLRTAKVADGAFTLVFVLSGSGAKSTPKSRRRRRNSLPSLLRNQSACGRLVAEGWGVAGGCERLRADGWVLRAHTIALHCLGGRCNSAVFIVRPFGLMSYGR